MSIRLLSFPRVLGYGFAPLSLRCAWDLRGVLRGVIYEAHNTFGGAHAYVSRVDPDQSAMTADKEFYVSPFFDVSGKYRFTLRKQRDRMKLVIENIGDHGRAHVASLLLRPHALRGGGIMRTLAAMPLSGLRVMAAIHWQALQRWLKDARYRAKMSQSANRATLAVPAAQPAVAHERPRKRA